MSILDRLIVPEKPGAWPAFIHGLQVAIIMVPLATLIAMIICLFIN